MKKGVLVQVKKAVKYSDWTGDLVTETCLRKWVSATAREAVDFVTPLMEVSGKQFEVSGVQLKNLAKLLQENTCPRMESAKKESVETKKNMGVQKNSVTRQA